MTVTKPPKNTVRFLNWHAQYLTERMRPDEIEQYIALTGAKEFDPEVAARGFMNIPGHKYTLIDDEGFPIVCGGYQEVQPGIWQSWMVGSMDGWGKYWRSITKASRWMMDGLMELGARRLQTNALASRTQAIEWYKRSLKMSYEGTWRRFGSNGEDVACFARVSEV